MKLPSEKPACPRKRTPSAVRTELSRSLPERGSKGCWDAEQPDRDLPSSFRARIVIKSLGLREARVRALRTGEDRIRGGRRSGRRRQAYLDALLSHQLHTGTPVFSAAGVARSRTGAGPTWSGCSSTLTRAPAWQWRCHSIDEAHASDTGGSGECWPHTPRADCHRQSFAAPGGEEASLLDSAASHPAGEESQLR
jgi:hypothetical protein